MQTQLKQADMFGGRLPSIEIAKAKVNPVDIAISKLELEKPKRVRKPAEKREYSLVERYLTRIRNAIWAVKLDAGQWYEVSLKTGLVSHYLWDGRRFHTLTRALKDHNNISLVIQPVSIIDGVVYIRGNHDSFTD